MSIPTLDASKWVKDHWVVPRHIYKVWWYQPSAGITERYVVADNRQQAISKAKRKWSSLMGTTGYGGVEAKRLISKGVRRPPYAPPKVHMK